MLTESDLQTINGLVARCRRLESEYLRTRQHAKGDELYTQIDRVRWTLLTDWHLKLTPFEKKLLPDGKGVA